jgi:predicted DNA-binding transcriptional regulator YafY
MQNVVERVINLLIFLLESPDPATATDIRYTVAGYGQESDDAFHRMFERDKDLLKKMGVPLEMKALDGWEIDFGYTVDPAKYALPDPGLTEAERVALSVAARMVRLGGANAGLAGLLKLGGMERGAGIEPLGADLGAEASVLGELFLAVTERRKVHFTYSGAHRDVDPYGMAHGRGHWYLVGQTVAGERVFRVDRMSGIEIGKDTAAFERPKRFDVKKAMSANPWEAGTDEVVTASVRFDEELAWWAARTLDLDPPASGPLEAEVNVTNRDAFIGWILGFGPDAEVLGPPELRDAVVDRIEAAIGGLG